MALPVTGAELVSRQLPQGAVDPAIKVPRQVVEAGRRAAAVQHAALGVAEPPVLDPDAPPPDAPSANGAASAVVPAEPAAPPPDANAPPAMPPAQVPGAPPAAPPTDWEHQFRSLQGRFEQQRDQIAQMSGTLQRMEIENSTLRATSHPAYDPTNPPPSLITEQEMAEYGPEFVDVIRRAVQEAAGPLQNEITNLRSQLGHVQQETTNAFMLRMNSSLDGAVPNWRGLNQDPKFIAWSQLPDVFSGAIRRQLMQDAWNSGDPNRLTAFFNAFLLEEAATNPQGAGVPRQPVMSAAIAPAPVAPPITGAGNPATVGSPLHPGAPQVSLSDLAAPGRAHSAASIPAEKVYYSPQDISRFYTDVAAGRWVGHEARKAAVEADIMLAQREGRILVTNNQPAPPPGMSR